MRSRHASPPCAAALVALLLAAPGRADEPPPPDPVAGEAPDGRIAPPSLREGLLALPRLVLLLPRQLLLALAWPVRWAMIVEERHHLYDRVMDALTSDDGLIGLRLALDFSLDLRPMAGLSFFDDRVLGPGTALHMKAEAGGADLVVAEVAFRPSPSERAVQVEFDGAYARRNDQRFRPIPSTGALDRGDARYLVDQADVWMRVRAAAARDLEVGVFGQLGYRRFGDGPGDVSDPPLSSLYCVRAASGACLPGTVDERTAPGFASGAQFSRGGAWLRTGTFDRPARPSVGAQIELRGDYSHGLGDPSSWFHVAGVFSTAFDLWERSHALVLRLQSELVLPLGDTAVPFTELATLGGADSLRGFHTGRFRDFSSVLATVEYRWAIWMWGDAFLFADWGGVFGRAYAGFGTDGLHPDVGAGLRICTDRHVLLRVQAAYGFPDGWQLYLSLGL